jgi:hypothetical protein
LVEGFQVLQIKNPLLRKNSSSVQIPASILISAMILNQAGKAGSALDSGYLSALF